MNIILVTKDDYISNNVVLLKDRRFTHIANIQKPEIGQQLKVGLINGDLGIGVVIELDNQSITLKVELDCASIEPLPLNLVLALPRPKMLKRVLQASASLGVQNIYLINSYRVDKSYWSSPVLSKDKLNENLQLGIEQAVSTHLPTVSLHKRFKPFVEDELAAISHGSQKLVAHPYNAISCPNNIDKKTTLIIGPEGGFIPYEIEKLSEIGFQPISLGKRILRVETAIPFAIAKLFSC